MGFVQVVNGSKILSNIKVVVTRQVKGRTAHFRLPSAAQKRRMFALRKVFNANCFTSLLKKERKKERKEEKKKERKKERKNERKPAPL